MFMEVNKRGLWLSFCLTYTTWFHRIVENSQKIQHVLTLLKVSDFHNMKLSIYWCKFPKRYCKGIWHQTFLKFFYILYKSQKIWNKQTLLLACAWKCMFINFKNSIFWCSIIHDHKKKINIKWQQVCRKLLKL